MSNEFMILYIAPKFVDAAHDMETAEIIMGYTRIDFDNDRVTQADFGSAMLTATAITHPLDSNVLYGVYTQLRQYDLEKRKLVKEVDLDHTYYVVTTSANGERLYLGGTGSDIAVYDAQTLEKITNIELDGDMGSSNIRVFTK